MKDKLDLYEKLVKKYGKVLTYLHIREVILENDIETAKRILKESYKEEVEYNRNNK